MVAGKATFGDPRPAAGYAALDNKGRLALPKAVRSALGVDAGSVVAYVLVGEALLVIPQDAHLAALMEQASHAVSAAGLTADDYLAELPGVRDELFKERYGDRTGQLDDKDWPQDAGAPRTDADEAVGPAPSCSAV